MREFRYTDRLLERHHFYWLLVSQVFEARNCHSSVTGGSLKSKVCARWVLDRAASCHWDHLAHVARRIISRVDRSNRFAGRSTRASRRVEPSSCSERGCRRRQQVLCWFQVRQVDEQESDGRAVSGSFGFQSHGRHARLTLE